MNTLLIDDDSFALKLLARQLEQLGCVAVTQCERAHDALALLEAQPETIGLVFCDLQMPGMDGVEFVRHLARIGYRGGLVLVSGEDARILQTVQKLAQAHHIHMLGALAKPVSSEQLRRVLASNASRSATATRIARLAYAADDLKRAIAGGELVNHYQPKVELVNGEGRSRTLEGMLLAVQPEALVVKTSSGNVTIPMTQVRAAKKALRWSS